MPQYTSARRRRDRKRRRGDASHTGKGQLAWYIGSEDCDESEIPQLPGFEGSLDIKEGDAETLRTFTFDDDSACFMSSALYSTLGLGSLEMTYVGDVPRAVNGTGHTGPSEFCATSI